MDFINRNARFFLSWAWLCFLSVVSFSPTDNKVNVHRPSTIASQVSRNQLCRSICGYDERIVLPVVDRLADPLEASIVNTRHTTRKSCVSPLLARPSTNSPQAENKGGIMRSLRKQIFCPLVSSHKCGIGMQKKHPFF